MTTLQLLLAVIVYIGLAALSFRVGIEWAMRAISRGAYWRLTVDEQSELDRLMEKALGKDGDNGR